MSLEQDVAAARRAVEALEQACAPVTRHFGDTVDVRRLQADVGRLRDDLTLLCGAEQAEKAAQARVLEIIEDKPYAADFWRDAEDEGLGAPGRKAP